MQKKHGNPAFYYILNYRKELLVLGGEINHVILQSGRELAADITRKLLRQAQDKCRTTTTSTTTTTTSTTTTTTTTNPISGYLHIFHIFKFNTFYLTMKI